MASEKITNFVEEIKTLSVLELKELVDAIQEEFGVTAMVADISGEPPDEELVGLGGAGFLMSATFRTSFTELSLRESCSTSDLERTAVSSF